MRGARFVVFDVLDDLVSVPIVPDYLYRLQQPNLAADETYKFLAKNCSNNEILKQRNYFVRHPAQFRRVLRIHCNWSVDWAMNKIENENVQRTIILEKVAFDRRLVDRLASVFSTPRKMNGWALCSHPKRLCSC